MILDQMKLPRGIKIALYAPIEPQQSDLDYLNGIGVEYVTTWAKPEKASPDYYASRKKIYGEAGVTVYGLGNVGVHNQEAIVLGLPERDAKIEVYRQHLRSLAAAGIPYTTYAHMANGIWSTARETSRKAKARAYDAALVGEGNWDGTPYRPPLTHGREYSQAELWDNYTYFIRAVAPLAEELGIQIGIHPDDPPLLALGGVPRCIFSSFDGYERALEIANSPNVGMCLCVGCWLEGGPGMGRGVIETIQHFGRQGKIFKVHFRNVDQPLPHFVESFINNGYQDMRPVLQALHEVGFEGIMMPDHVPQIGGNDQIGIAYSIGYMQALVAGLAA